MSPALPITIKIMFTVQVTVAIVNYDHNMLIVKANILELFVVTS
jgi:hypothetical protein